MAEQCCGTCNAHIPVNDFTNDYSVEVDDAELSLWEGLKCLSHIKINYCPMCGRRLDHIGEVTNMVEGGVGMNIETITGCLEKEHFCSMCVNEDSECMGYGCVYVNAAETIKRLQEENASLKSRLDKAVELPCKFGDTVYVLMQRNVTIEVVKGTFKNVRRYDDDVWWAVFSDLWVDKALDDFGKTVFLTEAEAQAKLDELKGGAE